MSRGSFSRTVARAAASGGSRAYRGRSPKAWYLLITCICLLGVGLIFYSRNEALHPYHAPAVPPTASDRWYSALGIDLCGKVQPDLPENSNFSTVGIRTAGDGVILIAPSAVTNASAYTGKHDTLGTFASSYPGLTLTATSIELPGMKAALENGDTCTSATGPADGKSKLVAEVWSSPTAKGHLYSGNLTKMKLDNKMMIMLGFVPAGTKLPVPPSKAALLADVNGTALKPTPTVPTTSTTSTVPPSTTTLAGSSTTLAGSSTTLAGSSTTLAGSSTTLAGSSTTLAGSSAAAAGSSTTLAGSSAAAAGSSTTLAGSSAAAAGSSTTLAGAAAASR